MNLEWQCRTGRNATGGQIEGTRDKCASTLDSALEAAKGNAPAQFWKVDSSDEEDGEVRQSVWDPEADTRAGAGLGRGDEAELEVEKAWEEPKTESRMPRVPLYMVEAEYRRPLPRKVEKTSPFRTGLLARMSLAGGVRAPKRFQPIQQGWVDALLMPIFGNV